MDPNLNFRINKLRSPSVEISPVNGNPVDNILLGLPAKKPLVGPASASKGSKLESALDRLGFQKRKVIFFNLTNTVGIRLTALSTTGNVQVTDIYLSGNPMARLHDYHL